MPKKTEHGPKRLTLNCGIAVTDEMIATLAVLYKIQSPALVKGNRGIERGHQRYTRALLFIDLVYRISDSESLLRQLKAFYVDHIVYFNAKKVPAKNKVGDKKKGKFKKGDEDDNVQGTKTFSVDEVFVSFATALAFKVTGDGGLSKLYRVLHHFFAVKHKLLTQPPKTKQASKVVVDSTSAKPRISLMADPKIDFRDPKAKAEVNDDNKPVQVILEMDAVRGEEIAMLLRVFGLKKDPLLRSLIETAGYDHQVELVQFVKHEYKPSPKGSQRIAVNFRSTKILNAVLRKLSMALVGSENRSLAMSIIISFFAQKAVRKPSK